MIREKLLMICKSHKLEICTDTTPYGRSMLVYLDDKKIQYGDDGNDEKFLLEFAYELNEKVLDSHNLDNFSCTLKQNNDDLILHFYFDNSWEYGSDGYEQITPQHLLPHLPDFINQFEEFKRVELNEDNVFCSFTYDNSLEESLKLIIHDVWSEGEIDRSFIDHNNLLESLKQELSNRIENTFSGDELWVCSEDGVYLSISSKYKEEYDFGGFFIE